MMVINIFNYLLNRIIKTLKILLRLLMKNGITIISHRMLLMPLNNHYLREKSQ